MEGIIITEDMLVTWHKRLLNLLIDVAVIAIIFFLLGMVSVLIAYLGYNGFYIWITEMDSLTDRIFTTLVMVLYLFVMEVTTQRSVGKFITGTIVVAEDGSKPEPKKIMVRALCRIIGIEALSFLKQKPRGWHDSASDTYVVDTKKYKKALNLKTSFEEIGTEII